MVKFTRGYDIWFAIDDKIMGKRTFCQICQDLEYLEKRKSTLSETWHRAVLGPQAVSMDCAGTPGEISNLITLIVRERFPHLT